MPCGDSAPAFRWWRVVNAERLGDHWNIGELEMFEPSGVGTEVDCESACADCSGHGALRVPLKNGPRFDGIETGN